MPFEEAGLWWFAVPPGLPEGEAARIRAFHPAEAVRIWDKYISPHPHLMLAGPAEWVNRLSKIPYCWTGDWNAGRVEGLVRVLGDALPGDERVWFFWSRECAAETDWTVFLRCWIPFLIEDEGPLLFAPRTGFALRFAPNGLLFQRRSDKLPF